MPHIEKSISDLKAHAVTTSGLFARQNRYSVTITPPELLQTRWNGVIRNIGMNCKTIDWPGSVVLSQEVTRPADSQKTAYHRSYPDLVAAFYCSANLDEYQFFQEWQDLAIDPNTGQSGYFKDYTGGLKIEMLNIQQRTVYNIQVHDCFPISIGTMQLDYSSTDSVSILPLTFAWRTNNTSTAKNGQVTPDVINALDFATRTISSNVAKKFERIISNQVSGVFDLSQARAQARIIGLGGFI